MVKILAELKTVTCAKIPKSDQNQNQTEKCDYGYSELTVMLRIRGQLKTRAIWSDKRGAIFALTCFCEDAFSSDTKMTATGQG